VVLDEEESELWEEGPKAAPAAGEDACPSGRGGVVDYVKDVYE
jgi:hypothetical protein